MASVNSIKQLRVADPRLVTSGQPSEDQLHAVAAEGFTTVINLALHDDPRYSLPDEAGLVRSLGLRYVHIPVRFDTPTEDSLRSFFAAMNAHRAEKLLVHCASNKRVTAFVGLYRVLELGWDREPAFALMRETWEPDATWASFIDEMLER